MLGMQPSPSSNARLGSLTSATSSALTQRSALVQSAGIDEKSQKDVTQILSKCIEQTRNLSELSQVLHVENSNNPSLSGHTDFYYPDLTYPSSHYPNELPEISKIKCVPIPPELMEQYSQIQGPFLMGLFTCISRAWLAIDNLIFFWNYEDGTDICFYDNNDEAILAVELFTPKPGTFDDGVDFGLCLATNTSVVLLSIDFIRYTKGNGGIVDEMRFSPQPIYSISTEGMLVNTIRASKKTGRIFMGAKDGSLYEFFYQNQAGWFSSQTKKINLSHSKLHYLVPSFFNFSDADSIVQVELDETSNVLYTLSENSTIQVFYLGANGLETSKISSMSGNSIAGKAAAIVNSNDKHLFAPIVSIAAITKTESRHLNLLAVTQFGIRLYFSLNAFDNAIALSPSDAILQSQQAPSFFQLVHVRIPPSIELSSQNRTGPVRTAFYKSGLSLMVSQADDLTDSVLLLDRDLFILHNHMKESKAVFQLDGRIRLADEIVPSLNSIRSVARENEALETIKSASGCENVPKLTSEFFDPPRRYVMITQQGCYIWNKLRPIDQFSWALMENSGPNSESVRLFFNRIYQRAEACALCLAVALLHSNDANNRISEWASQAFMIYSGDAEIRRKNVTTIGQNFAIPTPSYSANSQQQQYNLQQQHQQQLQYQSYNPHATMMMQPDSGIDPHPENSIYGDVTMLNGNPHLYRHHQQQQNAAQLGYGGVGKPNQPNFAASMSYINSPQKMSTPITLRTKQEPFGVSGAQPHQPFGQFRPPTTQAPSYQMQPPSAIGDAQQQQQQLNAAAQSIQQNECEIHFSGKHDAIYIYLARLLVPIWDQRLLTELNTLGLSDLTSSATSPETSPYFFATFTEINVQWYLNKLNELKRFMEINFPNLKTPPQSSIFSGPNQATTINLGGQNIVATPVTLFQNVTSSANTSLGLASPTPVGNTTQTTTSPFGMSTVAAQMMLKSDTRFSTLPISMTLLTSILNSVSIGKSSQSIEQKLAIEIENGSLYLFKQYLNRIVEIFGLWKILEEHKFHFISSKLEKQTQMQLMSMDIKTFLQADNSLLEQLITALLYRYIDDNANTDLLNQNLKQFCSSLYTNENAIFSKACEKLKQALNIKNDNFEKDRLLKEAVELMKQIGYVANITQICSMLYSAGCYVPIFELCLSAAEKRDPQNISLHFYRKGEPEDDVEGQQFFAYRTECYECMLDCLNTLTKTLRSYPSQQPQSQQQLQANSTRLGMSKEKLEDQINGLINYVMNTRDEQAHVSIFKWMVKSELENKLVALESPYLESFLIHKIKTERKSREYYDLLWRFYDYNKDYQNAAKVLTRLAEKYNESPISLKERVHYLTQAIVALNSSSKQACKDEINELNDRKDVALIQEKIYDELLRLDPQTDSVRETLQQLDSQLFDITKLYYDFAEKFDLHQCQLAIFRMSRHDDPKAIEILWKQIIANELEKVSNIYTDKFNDLKTQLAENISNIAREYVDDDEKYFPLTTMIDSLEFVSLSRGFDPEWTCTLLCKLNIPFHKLLLTYDAFYQKKDEKWVENQSRFINAIYSLIELFTKAPNATNDTDKFLFLRVVKDLLPKYTNELNRINDELARELSSKFRTITYMIERM